MALRRKNEGENKDEDKDEDSDRLWPDKVGVKPKNREREA